MKKLNAAIVVVLLFVFSCFISPLIKPESNSNTLTLPEYNVEEYKEIESEVVDSEEIKIEYYNASSENLEVVNYAQNNKTQYNTTQTSSNTGRLGNKGRLVIPTVNYSAALYDGLLGSSAYAQSLVDAQDSACYISCYSYTTYIGDHNYQGFENMKNSIPGVTKAYVYETDGSVSTYICVAKHMNSKKINGEIYDENNINTFDSGYDIAMVTCNNAWGTLVTVTYWNQI